MMRTLFERVLYLRKWRKSVGLFAWQTNSSPQSNIRKEAYGLRRRLANEVVSIYTAYTPEVEAHICQSGRHPNDSGG